MLIWMHNGDIGHEFPHRGLDLDRAARSTTERLQRVSERVLKLHTLAPVIDEKLGSMAESAALGRERTMGYSVDGVGWAPHTTMIFLLRTFTGRDWRPSAHVDQQMVAANSMPQVLRVALDAWCMQPPPLYELDAFREDGQSCMKLYSYPQFFVEQWVKLMDAENESRRRKRKATKKTKVSERVMLHRANVMGDPLFVLASAEALSRSARCDRH